MTEYIVVSGVDGSGKTSVINGLTARLEAEGLSVGYVWMRYNHYLVKVLHAVAKVCGLSVREQTPMGRMWLHRFYKSPVFCWLYVRASYLDNLWARRKVRRIHADVVICDRWVNDILIDLGAECHRPDILETKWYGRFQRLLPSGCKQFVVLRPREAVLGCRVENSFNEAFGHRFALYEQLALRDEVHAVDNSGTIAESIEQVMQHL